jgi:hypothetical protein
MAEYTPGTLVAVHPFVHRLDGEETIIGDVDRKVYLAIPTVGLDILYALADGKTVGEAAEAFETKYAAQVDINDFLQVLENEGFVRPTATQTNTEPSDATPSEPGNSDVGTQQHKRVRSFSFDWISSTWAKRLTGKTAFCLGSLVILSALVLTVADPALLPTPRDLVFEDGNFTLLMTIVLVAATLGVSLHEIAHATAARAAGASATLGISNLMWVLVAQTDISNIWMATKGQRIKAYLAGFFVDLVLSSLLVMYLYGARNGYLPTSKLALLWATAVLATVLFRIQFQFFFFVRTDIYYALTAVLNTKNLMADTERMINNAVKRLTLRGKKVISQIGIPARERRWVRMYAGVWVVGRTYALFVLTFAILPVLWAYAEQFVFLFTGQPHHLTVLDYVAIMVLSLLVTGTGLVLWLRGLAKEVLGHRRDAKQGIVQP